MKLGYTTGVFDLFHIGHVNILRNARSLCDKLIVGVTSDELVSYKNKRSVIPLQERIEIVRACKYVDLAIVQESMDKFDAHKRYKFDTMFVGDDWYQSDKWEDFDQKFSDLGVKIVYFPYTKGTSSSLLNEVLIKIRNELS